MVHLPGQDYIRMPYVVISTAAEALYCSHFDQWANHYAVLRDNISVAYVVTI